jgi:hypothetical protein
MQVMVVFDADMVARPNFFTKILEVMLDNDCALCLTPQGFNNVDSQCDIFNNLNLSFWEYMLPGEQRTCGHRQDVIQLEWDMQLFKVVACAVPAGTCSTCPGAAWWWVP